MTKNKYAKGSEYGPLQTDECVYLCPDCGGYGYIHHYDNTCEFCNGEGEIPLDDKRVYEK